MNIKNITKRTINFQRSKDMLLNDTSLLSDETVKRLNEFGLIHINTGCEKLTEETAIELIEWFATTKFIHRKDA